MSPLRLYSYISVEFVRQLLANVETQTDAFRVNFLSDCQEPIKPEQFLLVYLLDSTPSVYDLDA